MIAAARKDFSLATYKAVDDFENAMMTQANTLMAGLQQALLDANQAKSNLDAIAGKRKTQLLVMVTLGSTLLLAANLMSQKEDKPAAPPASAPGADPSDDLAVATKLIELAIEHARTPGDERPAKAPP